MNTTTNKAGNATEGFRPKFSLYHPNGKGTGCAMKLELHPAHDDHDGCIMMCLASQKTIGEMRGEVRKFPTFDWDNRICVKLDFADICKILQVLRGECESLNDGKGLYHRSAHYTTRVVFRHLVEPSSMYSLEVYRDSVESGSSESHTAHIIFNSWEALGIGMSFENSIGVICFGIPKVISRETSPDGEERAAYDLPA